MDYFLKAFGGLFWIVWWLAHVVVAIIVGSKITLFTSIAFLGLNIVARILRWWNQKWSL